jgi:hypothetical protein
VDFDYRLDLSEIMRVVETAEVVALYFPLVRKTLLIDGRTSDLDGPMVRVVPMVSTPDERLRSLRQLRPRFPRPDSITIIPWPKYIASLESLGIWERIVGRFINAAAPEGVRQCDAAYQELLALEREEVLHAIKGNDYKPLWDRTMKGRPPDEESPGSEGSA